MHTSYKNLSTKRREPSRQACISNVFDAPSLQDRRYDTSSRQACRSYFGSQLEQAKSHGRVSKQARKMVDVCPRVLPGTRQYHPKQWKERERKWLIPYASTRDNLFPGSAQYTHVSPHIGAPVCITQILFSIIMKCFLKRWPSERRSLISDEILGKWVNISDAHMNFKIT